MHVPALEADGLLPAIATWLLRSKPAYSLFSSVLALHQRVPITNRKVKLSSPKKEVPHVAIMSATRCERDGEGSHATERLRGGRVCFFFCWYFMNRLFKQTVCV